MNPTNLVIALAPAFAAGFAVQRLLEILDPLAGSLAGQEKKKIVLGLSSLVAGLGIAGGVGIRVLVHLGTYTSGSRFSRHDLFDLFVTGLVISAGTEGFNSILKFMSYKKEEKKEEAKTKALTAVTTQALFERRLNMACNYTRKEVSRLVLDVIRKLQHDQSITEASVFGPQGINNDPQFRSTYYDPIKMAVEKDSCILTKFSPSDCENAETVADIVDAVWEDLDPDA